METVQSDLLGKKKYPYVPLNPLNESANETNRLKYTIEIEFFEMALLKRFGKRANREVKINDLLKVNAIDSLLSKCSSKAAKVLRIQASVNTSIYVELTKNKQAVKRKEEPKFDFYDKTTVYLDKVPENSTNLSIFTVFSEFGKVIFISLNSAKQFAFVTFEVFC